VGEGPQAAELKAFAAKHGMENVEFTGFLSAQKQGEAWAGSAFSVVPSIWMEPFGMVVLEAWARERAVIAHQIGALPELVTHGETGLLAPPFQAEQLAATLARAFDSPAECRQMGVTGRQLLATKFTKALWLDQMSEVYRSIGFS
jgi:glycosyltransferase involved in cell wall biosynthesis